MGDSLEAALVAWFESPINDYGTPYVSHPLDFTLAEQSAFVALVREPRFVSREEQIAKLREIVAARKKQVSAPCDTCAWHNAGWIVGDGGRRCRWCVLRFTGCT